MTDAVLDVAIRRAVAAIAVLHSSARSPSGGPRASSTSTTCSCSRARCCAIPSTARGARARLWERYQRILIDEFQDTDPIQVELAALLGSDDPDDGDRPWNEMSVDPGRLFFVGDPKQSIYRFRRADIATFLAADATASPRPRRASSRATSAPRRACSAGSTTCSAS